MTARGTRLIGVLIAIASALAGQTSVRVNVGGPQYTDSNGSVWSADSGCDGSTFTSGNTISGTLDPTLYQTGRTANNFSCQYTVIGPAFYNVTVRFAETAANISVRNPRIFNVFINNVFKQTVNIVGSGSAVNTAADYTFGPIAVYGSTVTILFASVSNPSEVQAIDIEATGLINPTTTNLTWDGANSCLNINSDVGSGCGAQTPIPALFSRGLSSWSHAMYQIDCTILIACDASLALKNSGTYSWSLLVASPLDSDMFQVQDNIAATQPLEILKNTPSGTLQLGPTGGIIKGGLSLDPAGSMRPTCDSSSRGKFWATQGGAGVADTVAVCAKDNTDTYAWRTIY